MIYEMVQMSAMINKIKKRKPVDRPNEPIHGPAKSIHTLPLLAGAIILAEPESSSSPLDRALGHWIWEQRREGEERWQIRPPPPPS